MIAIYVRVSTEEQAIKGYSVGNQIDECIKKAGTTSVLKYVDEGYTGEILNRPDLERMRADAQNGLIEKIVCYDPDRLSRKLLNQLLLDDEFRARGIELVFVNGEYANTPEGQLFFSIRGAISEFEKVKIKERTMSGRRRKAQQGKVVKNGNLFGYDYDKEAQTYVINDEEAQKVRLIFELFTNEQNGIQGINGVAMKLMDLGIPTARGGKTWHRQVVRQILLNESYAGRFYQNRYDTEGDYVKRQAGEDYKRGRERPREEWIELKIPAIISEDQFNYAQKLIGQARRRYAGTLGYTYLLSGLVRCGKCGATMTGRNAKHWEQKIRVYECRKNYAGAKTKGCGNTIREKVLNDHIWETISELLNDPQKLKEHKDETKTGSKGYLKVEIERLQEQIEKTKKGRKRLLTLVSMSDEEDMDIEEVKEKMRELQANEKELKQKLENIEAEFQEDQNEKESSYILEEAARYFLEAKGREMDTEEKQMMLRMVLKEVEVLDRENVHIHTF